MNLSNISVTSSSSSSSLRQEEVNKPKEKVVTILVCGKPQTCTIATSQGSSSVDHSTEVHRQITKTTFQQKSSQIKLRSTNRSEPDSPNASPRTNPPTTSSLQPTSYQSEGHQSISTTWTSHGEERISHEENQDIRDGIVTTRRKTTSQTYFMSPDGGPESSSHLSSRTKQQHTSVKDEVVLSETERHHSSPTQYKKRMSQTIVDSNRISRTEEEMKEVVENNKTSTTKQKIIHCTDKLSPRSVVPKRKKTEDDDDDDTFEEEELEELRQQQKLLEAKIQRKIERTMQKQRAAKSCKQEEEQNISSKRIISKSENATQNNVSITNGIKGLQTETSKGQHDKVVKTPTKAVDSKSIGVQISSFMQKNKKLGVNIGFQTDTAMLKKSPGKEFGGQFDGLWKPTDPRGYGSVILTQPSKLRGVERGLGCGSGITERSRKNSTLEGKKGIDAAFTCGDGRIQFAKLSSKHHGQSGKNVSVGC